MLSASCCENWAERSQSQAAEPRLLFARVGWVQQQVIVAFVNSAVCLMVKHQPWAGESFRRGEEEEKGKWTNCGFSFSSK